MKYALALLALGPVLMAQAQEPVRAPHLPDAPYQYANIALPAHFDAARSLDNTPADNPLTDAGAALGRVLFYDTHLSASNTVACASCHRQQHAFADPNRCSVGFDDRATDRHANNLTGLRYYARARFFWDERAGNLEETVLRPVRSRTEMGEDVSRLPSKLASLTYYPELFRRAFGDTGITEPRIAKALAQFLRSMVSYQSRYDAGVVRAKSVLDIFDNFTLQENHGKALFMRGCATCHLPGEDHTFFVFLPANTGIERPIRVDGGFGDFTLNAQDLGRFKAPSLRNVEVAGPYMHNGSLATLGEVIDHYSRNFSPGAPLNFTDSEKAALIAFLKTLTDRTFLTDAKFSDPFESAESGDRRRPACPATTHGPDGDPPRRSRIDDVVARMLLFDRNADGLVSRDEVPERMADVVPRGDTDGSGSLDAAEIRAIASSQLRVGSGTGITRPDTPVPLAIRAPLDSSPETLLTDLSLDGTRHAAALAALQAGHIETVLTPVELADYRASVERHRSGLVAIGR
jgi:cytochrome c peroxidase